MYAYNSKDLDVFNLLCAAGADPSVSNKQGRTLVAQQVSSNNIEATNQLLQMYPDLVDSGPISPLNMAIRRCNEEMCTLLIKKHGAAIDLRDGGGRHPLFEAVKWGVPGLLELLLQELSSQLKREKKSLDPAMLNDLLSVAVAQGCVAKVRLLCEAGADPNRAVGGHPLMVAAVRRDEAMCALLIKKGGLISVDAMHGLIVLEDQRPLTLLLENKWVNFKAIAVEDREAIYYCAQTFAPDSLSALMDAGLEDFSIAI